MLYPECYITYLATIHRTRTLPTPGQVLGRVGDQVTSDTVIAKADVPMGYCLIELDQALGGRVSNIDKVMVKKPGDWVKEGEVIARVGTFVKTECTSPVRGQILDARGSKVLIEAAPRRVELTAFYPGEIVGLLPGMGINTKVTGALVQGAWGTGQEVRGRLEAVVEDGNTSLTADQITAVHVGTLLIGGRTLDAEALAQAIQNQVRAVIVGSLSSAHLSMLETSSLSVMVTEGFGDFPMNPSAFELLQSCAGGEACLSLVKQGQWGVHRPEILIPLPAEGSPPTIEYGATMTVGTRVRALRAPYENVQGEVVSLPPHRHRLESGIMARGAEIDLESVGKVFIPLENLEIIR